MQQIAIINLIFLAKKSVYFISSLHELSNKIMPTVAKLGGMLRLCIAS